MDSADEEHTGPHRVGGWARMRPSWLQRGRHSRLLTRCDGPRSRFLPQHRERACTCDRALPPGTADRQLPIPMSARASAGRRSRAAPASGSVVACGSVCRGGVISCRRRRRARCAVRRRAPRCASGALARGLGGSHTGRRRCRRRRTVPSTTARRRGLLVRAGRYGASLGGPHARPHAVTPASLSRRSSAPMDCLVIRALAARSVSLLPPRSMPHSRTRGKDRRQRTGRLLPEFDAMRTSGARKTGQAAGTPRPARNIKTTLQAGRRPENDQLHYPADRG